ncbi:hypothetical protein [Amycolatopsis rifamycinica]|uniref:DUF5666 domain-containing protein n=1 Tax=Amycolatopsis rifamycinica TaxID=287986 RepID=A0A066UAF4_9PSEU|nr:hypothetical protein [Amycolatopsis rifamycinica]KDN22852.1 hypothetical protein DV20_07390 [Amycolatopsis rifamycinica]
MTTPQAPSTPDQTWGAPSPKQAWSPGRKIAAGAVAAVIVAGGGAAIWAASSSAATDAQAGPGGPTGGMPGGSGPALHGEYVASDGNGAYVTKIMQTGEVTELSATSLTAKSEDGFSKTYTITSEQATGLAAGDTVTVVATESGSTATATSVTDGEAGPRGQGTPPTHTG